MRVIFGWGECKIKNYTSVEIGIEESILPNTNIQLVQEYFHLFFIPFFPTDKIWFFNSNGYWLKLSPEHETHITPKYKNGLAPWYTFSWILLLLLIGFGFTIYDTAQNISAINVQESDLQITTNKLTKSINHLNEHSYIGLETRTDGSIVSVLFLKVESIKGDQILCSIIKPVTKHDLTPLYIDSLYNHSKGSFDAISITKQILLKAIPQTVDEEKYNTSTSGVLIKGQNYSINDMQEHGKPSLIKGSRSFSTDGNFMFSFINQLDEATLIGIENDKGTKLNWQTKFPFTIPAGHTTSDENGHKSIFELHGTGYKSNEPFQFVLKCVDKKNKKINYLVKGHQSEYEIEEIY